jgi:hypothetical protein
VDAATAALVGASIGVTGTLLTAWLNPFSTARHSQAAKRLELRREAYATAIKAVNSLVSNDTKAEARVAASAMLDPMVQMRLVASPDAARAYGDIYDAVMKIIGLSDTDKASTTAPFDEFEEAFSRFVELARADIGTDE